MSCVPFVPQCGEFINTYMGYIDPYGSIVSVDPYTIRYSSSSHNSGCIVVEKNNHEIYRAYGSPNPGLKFFGPNNRYLLVYWERNYDDGYVIEITLVDLERGPHEHTLLDTAHLFWGQTEIELSPDETLIFSCYRTSFENEPTFIYDAKIVRCSDSITMCSAQPFQPILVPHAEVTETELLIKDHNVVRGRSELPKGILDILSDNVPFDEIASNQTSTQNLTFRNSGTDCLQVTDIIASAHFQPVNFSPFSLSPDTRRTVTLEFKPNGDVGTFNERIDVKRFPEYGDNHVHVNGTSHKPRALITVTPLYSNYGTVIAPNYKDFSFSITNTGEWTLINEGSEGPEKPEFKIVSAPRSIAPHTTDYLNVRFQPSSNGVYTDTIIIRSNAYNDPQCTITLRGRGRKPPWSNE